MSSESNNVATVSEYGAIHFYKSLPQDLWKELTDILKRGIANMRTGRFIPARKTNFGVRYFIKPFYVLFLKKYVSNLIDRDLCLDFTELTASSFLFEVHRDMSKLDKPAGNILELLSSDERFNSFTREFVNTHFPPGCCDQYGNDIVALFLSNIYSFQKKNFDDAQLNELETWAMEEVEERRQPLKNNYFRKTVQLNDNSVEKYRNCYETYKLIGGTFGKVPLFEKEYSEFYLLHLVENNIYELFSLLDENLFRSDRITYTNRFEKYLFFFIHAVNSDDHPVHPISSALFECLKYLRFCKTSRTDVFDNEMLRAIHMVAITDDAIERRPPPNAQYSVDERNLRNACTYMKRFANIEDAVVSYKVKSSMLATSFTFFIEKDNVYIDVIYNSWTRAENKIMMAFLRSAVSNEPVNKIVVYNALTEQEIIMDGLMDNPVRQEVRDFVSKHNNYIPLAELPVNTYFTMWHEKYYNS